MQNRRRKIRLPVPTRPESSPPPTSPWCLDRSHRPRLAQQVRAC
jgi:transposase